MDQGCHGGETHKRPSITGEQFMTSAFAAAHDDDLEQEADLFALCVVQPAPGVATRGRAKAGSFALPEHLARRIKQVYGADTAGLRVHAGPMADWLNEEFGSRAFTYGDDIFIRASEYRPGTAEGDALIAHEVAHALQQRPRSLVPFVQCKFGFEFELRIPVTSREQGKTAPPVRKMIPKPRAQNEMTGRYPVVAGALNDPAKRAAICEAMNIRNDRQWADEVLAGTRDSFFLDTVNPYSQELPEPALGPADNQSVGVVVENRDFRITYPAIGQFGVDNNKRYRPEEWPGFATRLYDRLRQMHQPAT
jgi:Domain of unknown function (DUF4157)